MGAAWRFGPRTGRLWSTITPDPKVKRLWLAILMMAVIIYLGVTGAVLYCVAAFASGSLYRSALIAAAILASWTIPAALYIPAFYKSIKYSITPTEVIVRRGVFWRRETLIPYHKIVDITIRRGPLERVFGLGRVIVGTAGWAHGIGGYRSGAVLAGLSDCEGVREEILSRVRPLAGKPPYGEE